MSWHIRQTHGEGDKDVVIVGKYAPQYLAQDEMITQCAFKTPDLTPYKLKRLITLGKHINLYITNNNYRTNYKRITAYVDSTECIALDIDYYNIPHLSGLSPPTVYKKLLDEVFKPLGIEPSYGIDSGRGLYLFFLLEFLPLSERDKQNRYLYNKVLKALIDTTKAYGADPNCADLSRVLRLPQTINQKSARLAYIIDFDTVKLTEPKRYSIEDLFKRLLPNVPLTEPLPKIHNPKIKNTVRKMSSSHALSLNSLGQARVKDLLHLLHLRGGKLTSRRNIFLLFLSLSALEYLYDVPHQARQLVEDVNELFSEALPETEVNTIFAHAMKNIEKRQKGMKGYYHYSNERIISDLAIADAECEGMKTIINTGVKYKRNNKRRRNNRRDENGNTKRQRAKMDKINKIRQLLAEGKKQAEIARILSVNKGLVSKYIKVLNETAL